MTSSSLCHVERAVVAEEVEAELESWKGAVAEVTEARERGWQLEMEISSTVIGFRLVWAQYLSTAVCVIVSSRAEIRRAYCV